MYLGRRINGGQWLSGAYLDSDYVKRVQNDLILSPNPAFFSLKYESFNNLSADSIGHA